MSVNLANYERDLARWIPRLLSIWRRSGHRRAPQAPEDRLLPHELKELAAGVRQLSSGLTRQRQLAGAKYMDDPKLLGAYLLFYWPISYAQARQALGELPRARSVLDLGSGPGPMGFAALDGGASQLTCADRSKSALALARELAQEAGESLGTREWEPSRPLPEGPFDLVVVGHLLNELCPGSPRAAEKRAALLERAAALLRPQGTLLVLEPALRETSRGLLEVRDLLVSGGYTVRAPCLWRGACPALVRPSDWCHAERSWQPPRLVEELARAAGLHKEALKMSYLALAPRGEAWPEPPPGRLFRIVSEPLEGKGRQRYIGCGPEGRVGLALQEKHRSSGNAAFWDLRRGDVIALTHTEKRGDGLALDEHTEVKVLARASAPLGATQRG